MTAYRRLLADAVGAVEILSSTRHSWLGRPAPGLAPGVAGDLDAATARAYLVHRIQSDLYAHFYCTGQPAPARPLRDDLAVGSVALTQALAAANTGSGCWAPGWTVLEEGAEVWVERRGVRFRARREQVRTGDHAIVAGAHAQVLHPPELRRLSPGFYMALADVALPEDEPLVRLYWNVRLDGAVALLAALTETLNRHEIAGRVKILNHPAAYYRCDAAVLYVPRSVYGVLAPLAAAVHEKVREHLTNATPALTKRLAHGLSLAEDPGTGESFGLHRCGLIAEGLLRAHEAHARGPARIREVENCLVENGVDPDTPYLAPGSEDAYSLGPAPDHA